MWKKEVINKILINQLCLPEDFVCLTHKGSLEYSFSFTSNFRTEILPENYVQDTSERQILRSKQ